MRTRVLGAIVATAVLGASLAATSAAAPASAVPPGMVEVFGDDFNGSTLDSSKWDNRFPDAGDDLWIYNASDTYAFDPANVAVHDGYLWIKNEKRTNTYRGKTVSYTSGVISSYNKFSPTYGYTELRMRHAAGPSPAAADSTQGTYHDLWLAPNNPEGITGYRGVDPWGWGSEVDVNEYNWAMGNDYGVNTHWGEFSALHRTTGLSKVTGSSPTSWHTYGLDWSPTALKFYLDGALVKTITGDAVPTGPEFLTLQGGIVGWGGAFPPNDALLPEYIQVDYIRHYQTPAQAVATYSLPAPNVLENNSFEDGWQGNPGTATPANWTISGTAGAAYTSTGSVVQGRLYLTHYRTSPYQVDTAQSVSGIPNGSYDLSAWVKSSGGQTSATISVENYGGGTRTLAIPTASTWTRVTISDVQVTSGQATVRFASNAPASKWIAVDNVVFHESAPWSSSLLDGTFSIENENSGKFLTAPASTANGGVIDQRTGTGGAAQDWQLVALGGGEYRIQSVSTGKVLDVYNNSTSNGATINQWAWNGGANQRWRLQLNGNGAYLLINVGSNKVLDVYNFSTADGAFVTQWTSNQGANQRWIVRP